jgi:hypothetical protein
MKFDEIALKAILPLGLYLYFEGFQKGIQSLLLAIFSVIKW